MSADSTVMCSSNEDAWDVCGGSHGLGLPPWIPFHSEANQSFDLRGRFRATPVADEIKELIWVEGLIWEVFVGDTSRVWNSPEIERKCRKCQKASWRMTVKKGIHQQWDTFTYGTHPRMLCLCCWWMRFNIHLKKISVVHSDKPNHTYLNPLTDSRDNLF
jgi:hypothetical protein